MSTTATPAPVVPTFKRGDLVKFTDRQGVTIDTRVRRVVIIPPYNGEGAGTRYYALDGFGLLVTDGLEAA